ncbi:MAG: hypothetical protein KAI55_02260 [Candidatus Aenigmarchaeota archaeon]|nr:hypothetical protein [Candidatus Aenigmarchaeota archaeon]
MKDHNGNENRIYVSFCPLGVYAFETLQNGIVEHINFSGDIDKRIDEINLSSKEAISKIEAKLLEAIAKKKQYKKHKIVFEVKKKNYDYEFPNKCGEYIRNSIMGSLSQKDSLLLVETAIKICENKIAEKDKGIDLVIVLSSMITDIEKSMNVLFLHLKSAIELYNPYLQYEQNLNSEEKYIKYIHKNSEKILVDIEDKTTVLCISDYANQIKELLKQKESIKKQIDYILKKETPTLHNLIGADLCAKYLRHAGSLRRLAFFPASTIQVLGAEKALFRHLKTNSPSPKYGILYMATYVMSAGAKNKGKVARILAQKISLAAKMDLNKNRELVDVIKKDFETQYNKIV